MLSAIISNIEILSYHVVFNVLFSESILKNN